MASLAISPLTVYADSEYIGGIGSEAGGGNKTYADGVSQNKTGLFVYTLDADGSVTNDMPILVLNEAQEATWNDSYKTEPIKTRFDNGGEEKFKKAIIDIPNIILHKNGKWVSNWYAVREYWDGKASDPTDNGVKDKFLQAMRQRGLWTEAIGMYDRGEPFYIAIETIAWSGKYIKGKADGKLASTAEGWAKFYNSKGMEYADTSMKSFYSAGLPFSLTLDRTMFGWKKPGKLSGYVTNEEISSKGYGINFILVNGGAERHTIVTPEPASAEVESPTPTNYSVIKVYERMNQETQEIIAEGSYITTNAYSELSINKEDGFEIVSAETVSQMIAEVGGADSYDTITSGKTIKQTLNISNLPTDVTLSQQEPTLIVRYRATDLEIPPIRVTGTHTVPEQRITQSFRDTLIDSITFTKNIYFK